MVPSAVARLWRWRRLRRRGWTCLTGTVVLSAMCGASANMPSGPATATERAIPLAHLFVEGSGGRLIALSSDRKALGSPTLLAQYMSNICATPYGLCYMAQYGPIGSPCWCPSPYGPIGGVVR